MFSWRSVRDFSEDLFNTNNLRNEDNTYMSDYNCGGYALGTFSWYCPSEDEDAWGMFEHRSQEEMEVLTAECVAVMLDDFKDLRLIESMDDLRKGEYAIAFRVSSDGDFHYVKQFYGKWWRHKRGSGQIFRMSEADVFNTIWCGRYDGPLVLFAKKVSGEMI